MAKVRASELKLGDVVRFDTECFGDALVKKIERDGDGNVRWVTVERPFMQHEDFSCSGGKNATSVIAYIGHEDVVLYGSSEIERVQEGRELR